MGLPSPPPLSCRGSAWEHEFWAPSCAEAALAITESHARRAAWLPSAQQRAAYMEAVPQVPSALQPQPRSPEP
jgi:hypothetical protein